MNVLKIVVEINSVQIVGEDDEHGRNLVVFSPAVDRVESVVVDRFEGSADIRASFFWNFDAEF